MTSADTGGRAKRSPAFTIGLTLIALLLFSGFCALGGWQVHRLAWKHDLIARVNARIHAAPVPAPALATKDDEYRRVTVTGTWLHEKAALTQATTIYGAGYWVMTPLRREDGTMIFVNRGFVPPDAKTRYDRPEGIVHVTGLLRLTEPHGGFLRSNDPANDRWHSRDIAAIAASRRLSHVAGNFFIDAGASAAGQRYPVGGLTIVHFPDNHLQYAITWFILAAMTVGAYILVMRKSGKDRPE